MSSTSRRAVIAFSGAGLALAISSCAAPPAGGQGSEPQPPDHLSLILIRAMLEAFPPEHLAAACLTTSLMLRAVRMIPENNSTITTTHFGPKVIIDKANAGKYAKELAVEWDICLSVIEKRGHESFAGTYTAHANEACGDAKTAAYLTNINRLRHGAPPVAGTEVIIEQMGFTVAVTDAVLPTDNPRPLNLVGIAVEDGLALVDTLTPGIAYTGKRSGRKIVLWPERVPVRESGARPDWKMLEKCVITLSPLTAP